MARLTVLSTHLVRTWPLRCWMRWLISCSMSRRPTRWGRKHNVYLNNRKVHDEDLGPHYRGVGVLLDGVPFVPCEANLSLTAVRHRRLFTAGR